MLGAAVLGISAAHWLPGLQMYRFSPRAGLTYEVVSNGFRPAELLGLLRPNPGQWSPLYVGLIPLALAAVGVVLWRRAETWFWAAVALAGTAAVFGPLRSVVSDLLSIRPRLRDLPRSGADCAAGELLVGGAGGVRLRGADAAGDDGRWTTDDRRPTTDDRRGAISRSLVPGSWSLPLRCSSSSISIRANNGIILQPPPADGYFAKTPIVTHIQSASPPDWRTSSEGLLPGDGESGIVFQIRDIVGSGPLYLAAYDRFLAQVPEERWWRMLNVQHLITKRDLPHGALKLVRQDGDLRLYQVFQNATLPWIVHAFKLAPDQDAAIQATGDPALDPFQQVILETPPDPPPAPPVRAGAGAGW